jgi:hypothetical protein
MTTTECRCNYSLALAAASGLGIHSRRNAVRMNGAVEKSAFET